MVVGLANVDGGTREVGEGSGEGGGQWLLWWRYSVEVAKEVVTMMFDGGCCWGFTENGEGIWWVTLGGKRKGVGGRWLGSLDGGKEKEGNREEYESCIVGVYREQRERMRGITWVLKLKIENREGVGD